MTTTNTDRIRTSTTYTLRDAESGVTRRIRTRRGLAGARAMAREWTLGAYDAPSELGAQPYWVDVDIIQRGEVVTTAVVRVDPVEPACDEASQHDYRDSGDVFGHGGGVICQQRCRRCGLIRRTDTWATRLDTGEQGLRAVSYLRDD